MPPQQKKRSGGVAHAAALSRPRSLASQCCAAPASRVSPCARSVGRCLRLGFRPRLHAPAPPSSPRSSCSARSPGRSFAPLPSRALCAASPFPCSVASLRLCEWRCSDRECSGRAAGCVEASADSCVCVWSVGSGIASVCRALELCAG